jgi:hypothetical protein
MPARRAARRVLVTDGPFVETKEAVGGFDPIECGSLEEAIEIAARQPVADGDHRRPATLGELTSRFGRSLRG